MFSFVLIKDNHFFNPPDYFPKPVYNFEQPPLDSNKIELFLKTLTNKLIIKKSNKIRIRLHVYTNNNSTKPFLKQITNVINEKYKNDIELSPVNFDKVIVIVVLDDIFEYNIIIYIYHTRSTTKM